MLSIFKVNLSFKLKKSTVNYSKSTKLSILLEEFFDNSYISLSLRGICEKEKNESEEKNPV